MRSTRTTASAFAGSGTPSARTALRYGVEEMLVVLSGTPTVRTPEGGDEGIIARFELPRMRDEARSAPANDQPTR